MDYNNINSLLTSINDDYKLNNLDSNGSSNLNTLNRDMEVKTFNKYIVEPTRFTENTSENKKYHNDKINQYNFDTSNNNNKPNIPFFDHKEYNISTKDIIKDKNNTNNKLNSREKIIKNI
tara:strand:+ start:28 stop:387 length:360 start_codon:yes stop_codon:yes gene_type:complete